MLVEKLKDQWICSCGNWVDEALYWCPDCCEDKLTFIYDASKQRQTRVRLES